MGRLLERSNCPRGTYSLETLNEGDILTFLGSLLIFSSMVPTLPIEHTVCSYLPKDTNMAPHERL
jgi:hypothetical protein